MVNDVVIIGGGIIGSTIAYELAKTTLKVSLVEKNSFSKLEVSGHNSAIVHSGIDPISGTLKEKYNLIGSKMYEEYARKLQTYYRKINALVVSTSIEGNTHLSKLVENATKRHIEVELLSREDALLIEPNLTSNVLQVLSMPSTAIIDPVHLTNQALSLAAKNGLSVHYNEEVLSINTLANGLFEITTTNKTITTRSVVNAAGLYASAIEQLVSKPTFELTYTRGDYIVLKAEASDTFKNILYPLPTNKGKGVLIVPQINGTVLVGPTAVLTTDLLTNPPSTGDIASIKSAAELMVTNIPYHLQIDTMTGIRPKELNNDFIIAESPIVPLFFNIAGIDSPGIAAAPAIASDFVSNILLPRLQR